MNKQKKFNQQNSKLILEELEERRLFSGGIEGLISTGLDSEEQALYADLDANKTQTDSSSDEASVSAAEQQSQEIVFVDAGVDNHQQLVDDLLANSDTSRNIEVVVLDRDQDGIEQISAVLQDRDDLDAVHIISHGDDGSIELGNNSLNAFTLEENNLSIALWANSFAETGDILIYGCNLAETEAGQSLIDELSSLTLTDVAASTDLTGQGGDWDLEFHAGTIETTVAVSDGMQASFDGSLALIADGANELLNETTSDAQKNVDIGLFDDGSYVAVWDSLDDGSGEGVYLRILNADGTEKVTETLINQSTTDQQVNPSVAVSSNGDFVVTWTSTQDGSSDVYTRVFDANGTALSNEILVNTGYTTGEQWRSDVAIDDSGNFVVTWEGEGTGDDTGIFAQRYDNLGNTVGSVFMVNNTVTAGVQEDPAIAMNGSGAFVITWSDQSAGDTRISAQLYSAAGVGQGEFVVHATADSGQGEQESSVAMDDGGNFVVAWSQANADSDGFGIEMQRFDASGNRLEADDVQVNTTTAVDQFDPAIAMQGDGSFVVSWTSVDQDGDAGGMILQQFNADGTKNGGEVVANTYTISDQHVSQITTNNAGMIVVAWEGEGAIDTYGVWSQRYNYPASTAETVADNFSSGDFTGSTGTQAWTGDWIEVDGGGAGASTGNVVVTAGEIRIRALGSSIAREVDLLGATSASFSFDYHTGTGIEAADPDSLVVEVSGDGGSTWTTLEDINYLDGANSGSKSYDISAFAAVDTQIRFRVNNGYGGPDEYFYVDNVQIDYVPGNKGTAIWRDASTTPQTSDWDGGSFGSTTATAPSGDYRIMQGAESPTRDEIIIIGVDESSEINGEIWDGSSWSTLPANPLGTVTQSYWWSMDVAYEQQSGDAVMVWADGTELKYSTWDGSSWTAEAIIQDFGGTSPRQIQLAAQPSGDEMVMVVSDSSGNDTAWVWDGSNWTSQRSLDTSGGYLTSVYVAYEQQSGDALVTYAKSGDSKAYYQIWDGSSWSAEASVTPPDGVTADANWITLASDPGSDRIAMGVVTNGGTAADTWLSVWNGTSWEAALQAETSATGSVYPNVAVAFESTSGQAIAVYGENGSNSVKYRTWDSGSGWSTEQIGPDIGGVPNSLILAADPISDQIMLSAQDANSHVNYVLWDGSGWGTPTELGTSTTEVKNQPFLFLWDQQAVINDAPANAIPATQNTAVDTVLIFSSANGNAISVADTDDTSAEVTLSATNGTLTLSGTTGLSFSAGDGVGDTDMTFIGTLADINAALDGLQFDPTAAFEGFASVQISTTDAGAGGAASPENDTDSVTIEVGDVNSPPVNTVPAAQTINQDGMLLFSGATGTAITISDADAGGATIQVTLAATNGTLNLQSTSGLSFSVGDGSADTDMTFTATIADINAALEGMTFLATPGFTGAAAVQITTDDLGNSGAGGALVDADSVAITVQAADQKLWLTLKDDIGASGDTENLTTTGGDILTYGDISQLETSNTDTLASTTSGTLAHSGFNLDTVLLSDGVTQASDDGNTQVNAVHVVTADIQVGSNNIQLLAGDILLSTNGSETIGGVTYDLNDVFVFRPDTAGDYTQGSFFLLIDGSDVGLGRVTAVSLVEQSTVVGDTTLTAGEFLLAHDNSGKNVVRFTPGSLGATTSGSTSVLLAGADIDIGQNIGGIHLLQADTEMGGQSLGSGQLLMSLQANDSTVGAGTTIDVKLNDIFVLDVTATGSGTTAATASRLVEGLDENLDSGNEAIWGIGYQGNAAPSVSDINLAVDENSANGTVVGTVIGNDPEDGASVNYAITAGNTGGAFAIDTTTGQITVADSTLLDFETTPSFSLTVAAVDSQGAYDTATVTIDLNNLSEAGVNDAPENVVPAAQTIQQDGILVFSAATGTEISISDFDAASGSMQVTLNATNGTLNLSGTSGLLFSVGDGSADTTMTFTGTLADINAALEGMTFVSTPGFIGAADVQITTDDQGNTGTGGALIDTDSVAIDVIAPDSALWLTFENDEGGTGNAEIPSITAGDVVTFSDITQLEASDSDPLAATTAGTLAYSFNLDTVLLSDGVTLASDGNTIVNAVHYVGSDIQVGSNNIQLQAGDLILSTGTAETIGGVTYEKEDVFIFRPDTVGDYTQGSFFRLIDGKNDAGWGSVTGIALVEQETVVGGVTLSAGEFLVAHDGDGKNILRFTPGTLGDNTTGTTTLFVAGADINIGQNIGGLHLVQNDTELGGVGLTSGQLLVSLQGNDSTVGSGTTIDVLRQDIFVLDVSATGVGTSVATASRLFEGLDENLDNNNESVWGIGFQANAAPEVIADTFTLDENSANSTVVGSVSATDPELGTLTYAITGGNTDGAFAIDASTGQITVANSAALDFETTPSFSLTVAAIDPQGAYGSAMITVNLNDLIENQAPTDLVATSTTDSGVTLNADGGNDVYFVADNGGVLLGGLTTVTIEASFAITSPVITYAPILSYADGSNDEELAILLEADGSIRFGANSNGTVLQDTIGTYTQLFDGNVHHVGVSWDSATGAVDFYVDGTLVESFSGYQTGQTITGTGELVFGQDQDSVLGNFNTSEVFSGTLYDIRIFDDVRTPGEIGASYNQTLPSTEAGMIANWVFDDLSVNGVVTDTVSGNNLTQQQVVGAGFTTSVAELNLQVFENAANGTVVGNLVTLDPDSGDTFTYSLQDDAGGRFAINPTNGEITVADGSLIDFDTANSHDITVRTTDAGGLTYDEVFTITVADVNNDPMITSDGGGATVAINVAENTTAVTTVTATDPDLQTPTFAITGGADQGLFSIDSISGALTFDIAPDYEGAGDNLYEVEVTASDGVGGTDVQAITVRVTDVAEGIRVTSTSVVPLGDETLVNTETTDNQIIGANVSQAIATDANGNYVIAWASNLQDGSGWGVYAQLFNADGTLQGSEIQIHTTVADSQLNPTVAMDDAGNFVVAWQSENQDGSSYGVYTRSFDAAGNPTSTETLVSTETANYQGSPGIAMAPNGDYVVIWTSSDQDNPDGSSGIYAQLFNADGSTNGGEFLVNTYTLGHQQVSSVSMDDGGNFVVTWGSQNQDGSNYGVFAQLFDANGVTLGSEFQVNTTTDYSQLYNDVVMLPDGRFVVAFQSVNADTSTDLLIQRYESDGTPLGGEIKVNSVSDMNYFPIPSISADDSGNFTVAWNNSNDGAGNGVFVRSYDWDGNALTGELQVNTTVTGDQTYPDVVAQPGGGFIVVWGGEGAGDANGVFTQRYGLATDEDGGSTAFELVLESAPTADVVIPISVSDGSEGSVSVGSITFTSGNWNIAQTVTVTGLQDFVADGDQVYTVNIGPATSADPNFNGLDPADLTITNIETNSPPQLTNGSNTSYGEGSGSTPFLTSTLTDINSADFDGGTLTFSIASGGDGTDELRLGIMNGVTVSGNNVYVDGVLVGTKAGGTSGTDYTISFNSNATPARAQTLFQNLIIFGAGDNPTTGVRNLEVTVTDGDGGTSNTATATADLTTVVNDPPVISIDPSPILYLNGTMNVDPNLTVSDVDDTTLESAQVWFGDGYLRGQDRLLFTDQLGISGSFDMNSGILTLTGNASVADYQTALRSVQYEDFNPTPAEGILYVNFSVSDGTDTSLVDTRVLEIVDNLPPRAGDNFGTVVEGASVAVDLAANDTDADDSLDLTSIVITSGPANGSIVVNGDGTVTYTHDGSETLSDTFTYTIKDTDGNVSNEAPVTITVTPVNDAPIATGNTVVALEDVPLVIGVADFNFTDAELDSLASVTITGLNLNGGTLTHTGGTVPVTNGMTITAAQLADLTFTSAFNDSTNSSFTYTVNDADLGITSATMNITVTQADDAGTFGGNTSATTNEDTATAGTVTFADTADGFTTPNFSLNTAASNGVAAIDSDGNWTYTPSANYNGSDSFTVQVTDDDGNVETQVISLTITAVDDTGTFGGNTSATTNEDTATAGTVTFADTADGFTTPNFSINTAANNGVAAIDAAGNWTYTPTANYNGADSFTVQVTDDDGNVETQVISLTVTAIDDTGTFGGNTSATTNEDTATAGTVTFADTADGFTTPNFSINTAASNGVAAIDAAGNWTYTPTANYNGTDSFTVQVTDDDGNVETQVVSITVTQIDDTGTFGGNTSATTNEDTATAGTVTFADTADGFSTPNFSLNAAASNGVAAIDAAGNWTYTPTANYNGADSFTVQVTDDDGNVETQVISLTVTQIDDTGTFGGNTSATTNEDTATAGTVTFADTADGFTTNNFALNTAATNGVAAIDSDGNWTYTPTANYNGTDSFVVQVTDDDGNVETQVVSITVTQIDDTGTFGGNTSATTNEDTATAGTVTFADTADGFSTPNFSLNAAASNGVAAIDAAGNWTYTPTANYNGADSFTVQVTDDDGNVETQVISLTVTQIDDTGTFGGNTSATTNEDTATAGTVTFADTADGFTTNNFALNTAATNGVAAIDSDGNWTYTPTANYNGTDSFVVQVTDDDGNVETQVVSITVTQIDDTGTFGGNTSATTNEDTATAGTVTFADTADGFTTNNFALNTAATNGVAAIDSDGNWTYTPTANYNGTDSFVVQVTDDDGNVETQVVSITVTQIDDTGTFGGNTSATTNEDTATAGTVTFSDTADGFTTPNFSINAAASNGVAAIDAAGNWTYTPTANYNGADSFTVQVTDDDGNVETQVISITVTQIDDTGTFGGNTSATTNEDTATAGTVTFADTADGFSTPNFSINTAASNGVAAIDAAGNWTYTPTANYNGADSFTVQVTDDDGNVETQVISITVTQIDDTGTFGGNTSATTNEDTATAGTVTFADAADGFTTPNFSLNTAASNGVAAIDAAGNWTYTPTANYNGADSFTVQVTDDDGNVETQVISLTVTAVDDAGTFGGNTSATTNEDTATAGTVTFADTADGFTTPNFSLNTAASNGVAAIDAAGNWTYTPSSNYNGSDSFTVQVTDDDGNVETQVISLTVTQIDDTGTFGGNTSATTNEDTATAGTVTFADTADGFTTPNFSLNTAASNGVAAIDAAGNWTYTPTANYNGADSFTVQVTDDDGNVETQVISLTVTQIDDTGTFGGNTSATTNEDTATAGTVTFSDTADGFTTPNFSLNTAASNGVAAIDAAGNWTYTPTANYNGADSFTVQVTDDDGNVETQVISLTVTAIDDTGTFAGNTSATTNEDTATAGTVTFADAADGFTTPNFSLNTAATNGVAAIDAAGNWTYTPGSNYNGADSFTVQVTDDDGNVETQVISLTVTAIDDTGTFAGNTSATTNEDTATAGTVTFSDAADGFSTPNFSINAAATNGVAAIDAAGNWTYTPGSNYNGADSFTVQVTDDDGNVETQVISLTVTPVNNAGTFGGNTSATTNEDTATAGTVTFADTADGFTTPNFSLNTAATNGVAAIDAAGNWTYTPGANYNGADSFTVQVTDDDGNVETQVISLTVTQIDDTGTFGGNTSATTNEDTATAGTVTFSDTADGFTTPNFSLNTAATNGVAAIDAAGNWTYTPTGNYNGADSFTVQVTDDDGNVETQVISITVTPIDDTGTFGGNTSATTNEDTATAGTVTFSDAADGFSTPNFSLNTAASNGVAAIDAAGNWTYTPTANYNGADSFTVQVTDDDGNVETQVISLTITAVDDAGTFGGNTSATTNEDTATAGTVTFADTADGFTTPNFSLNTAASNGVAAIDAAGNWTYTPTANYNGADSFTVQVTDDDGNVETQVVSITVTQIDDTGSFGGNTSATTNEDTATAGTVTFADTADGFTTPNFSLNTAASNGVAAIDAAGNWTYTPTANYNGADSFTVQVTDDDGNVETQVISLTVTQIDDTGSFGGNTSATTNEDTATAGTVTFSDAADGFTTPNFSLNTAATNGVAAIDAAGNWTYTPTGNYNGADSFTVQVTDDDGNVETQVISITVTPIDDTGTFGGNTSATTNEDTATAGTVTFADTADGFTTPNFSLNTAASNGVAAIDAAGNWTYTPSSNYNGSDSFTVQVTDDDGNVETQVVSITVTQIDDTGTFAGNTSATTNEDTATAGTVTFSDAADGFTTPNFSLNAAASNGVAAIDAAGNWTYTPTGNYNGADSFTVQVTDDDGNVETQVISITVTPIDDTGTFGGDVSATTNEDIGTSGTVTFADTADGFTTPNFSINTAASNGVAAIDAAGNWTYTPTANYNGADSFVVQVTDDDGNVETQTINITVSQVDDAGTFGGDVSATTDEDTATAGTVTFADTADGFTTPNFSLNTAATNGVAAIDAAGNWTYTPATNFNGADSFVVQVTDDDGNVETQTINVTVSQVDDTGTFGGDVSATTNEDTQTSGTVTFADTADGYTTNNFALNTAATNGVAAIDSDGNWTYTPSANYNGTDSFVVQVTDDDGNVETQTINITVNQVDDAGTFGGDVLATTNEDTQTSGTVTFADAVDGYTTNNFALTSGASNGTAAIDSDGNWTYTPTTNYNGADSFVVQVTDDDGNVETQTINITVSQIDDAGTFGGDVSATTNEDTGTSGTVTFADSADGFTTPNFSLNTAATNGVAAIDAAGNWTYTPTANFNGADSFTVQVTDDDGNVEIQTINITVSQVDDTGTFGGDVSATTNEDIGTSGTVTFADTADGFTTPNFSLNTAATNGVAAIDAAGNWTYTPTANFNGADSFVVQVTDDDGNVETQTITITVSQINDTAVIAGTDTGSVQEDIAVVADNISTSGTLTITDPDSGESSFQAATVGGTYGDLTIDTAGNWSYSADNTQAAIQALDSGESLTDTLTVSAFDGTTHNVVITINGSEDAAVISGTTTGSVAEDGTLTSSGALTISDTDTSDSPSFANVGVTAGDNGYGTFEMTAGTWTYTLNNAHPAVQALDVSETLSDTFTFSASDGSLQLVTVTINGAEDAPVFDSSAVTAATEDVAYSYTITTSDVDVESVTITAPTLPGWLTFLDNGNGTATLSGTPTNAEVGTHNVVLNVSDGTLSSNQNFTITVSNTNDLPVIGGINTGVVTEDQVDSTGKLTTAGALTITDSDIGQSNFMAQTIQGNFGAMTIDAAGNWSYSADNSNPEIQALQAGESMTETLTVTTADGSTHDVEIIINGAAEAPPAPPPPEEPPPEDEPPVEEPPEEVVEEQGGTGEDPILEEIIALPQAASPPAPDEGPSLAQTDEPESEPVDYGPVLDKQTVKIPEQPQPQALQAQNLSIDTLSLQVSDDEALNEQYELELLGRIDSMHLGMDDEAAQQNADDVNVQIFVGSTASLTVGIVSWVLRGGALLASFMSTVPLLNRFDPLPILKNREDEEDVEPDDDDDEKTQIREHARKVDNMFSGKGDSQQ